MPLITHRCRYDWRRGGGHAFSVMTHAGYVYHPSRRSSPAVPPRRRARIAHSYARAHSGSHPGAWTADISSLMEAGVDLVACDNPHATRLTIHILAAVA